MADIDFDEVVRDIRARDPRYSRNAYLFAFQSLEYTMKELLKLKEEERRHVSAKELLEGMLACAVDQYGYLARHVWEKWGVRSTDDWGNIIYNLINVGLMKDNEEDRIEDFSKVYDFGTAFNEHWKA